MYLGTFSISLAVKDLEASRAFYEKFGFTVFAGDASQNWPNSPTSVSYSANYEPKGCSWSSRQTRAQRGRPASSLWTRMGTRACSISTCEQVTAIALP